MVVDVTYVLIYLNESPFIVSDSILQLCSISSHGNSILIPLKTVWYFFYIGLSIKIIKTSTTTSIADKNFDRD